MDQPISYSGSGSARLYKKFVRADDAMKDSEETATAVNVSQTTITRERSFSLLIHESKSKRTGLEAYRSC